MALDRLVYRLAFDRAMRRERVFRDRFNPFDHYDDFELRRKFRFEREDILYLCRIVEDDIDFPYPRLGSLPALTQLLIAVRFYASGGLLELIADLFGVHKSTVSRVIKRVSNAFSRKLNEFVHLPTQEEAERISDRFYQEYGFPKVLGCIDCTHVKLIAPSQYETVYVNRKGRHSINVQLVCDINMIFVDCDARWPGSTHDARILRESSFGQEFSSPRRPLPDYVCLGDSGYPLKEWLLTPFLDPANRSQRSYNAAHRSARSVIERANGVLKMRWQCLFEVLRYKPRQASRIIATCVILHNVATTRGIPDPEPADHDSDDSQSDSDSDAHTDLPVARNEAMAGRLARDRIVQRYFLH